MEFALFVVGVITVTAVVMVIIDGELLNMDLWYKWIPLLFGLIMFGPSLYLVEKTGTRYYYLFGIVASVIGLLLSAASFPDVYARIFLYFIILGILAFITGIIKYILFIRKYPVIQMEEE